MRPCRVALSRVLAAVLALALAGAAGAEERRVDGVGVVAVKGGDARRDRPPREAALQAAIGDAVRQVAKELAPEALPEALDAALGADPRTYANRFRILEDRGEGPALLIEEPGVESEYVMIVATQVDVARVRLSLERANLLAPELPVGDALPRERLRIVIEDLDGHAGYQAVRTLLDDLGVHGAVPVEVERGRAVLEVASRMPPRDLLDALVRQAPPELRIEPVSADGVSLTLRARFLPPLGGTP